MIILSAITDVIRFGTSSANALDVHASFVDNTTLLYTPGRQNTAIAATPGPTTVLSAPAAVTQRQLKKLTANARGGANTVTVEYFDGVTAFRALSVALASGETLEYEDATGWMVRTVSGELKVTFTTVVPTGTGFRHVTAGVEDPATKLVDTADINNDQVTYAKIQNVSATSRVLGRITAGAGDTEELTGANVATILGTGVLFGRFVGFQVLTSGTTYTPTAGVTSQMVEGVGGGGGGGGVAISTAGQITFGTGGGAGSFFRRRYAIIGPATGTYAIGAAGTAGANTGAVAGNGGSTTFTDGTTLCTAPGGSGAPAMLATGTSDVWNVGGTGGTISTNGQINQGGRSGGPGNRCLNTGAANQAFSGEGGSGPWGGGGQGRITSGAGNNAIANSGAGGGGALSLSAAAAAVGGTGGAGIIIVWEFA